MSLSADDLKLLITLWKEEHGVQKTGRSGNTYIGIPNGIEDRRESLRYLIDTLVHKKNYKKDDFTIMVRNMIIESCVYSDWEEKKRLAKWRELVEIDVMVVIAEAFGEQEEFIKNERKEKKALPLAKTYVKSVKESKEKGSGVDSSDYDTIPEYTNSEEDVVIKKPLDRSLFSKGMPELPPAMSHEELFEMLEKELEESENE